MGAAVVVQRTGYLCQSELGAGVHAEALGGSAEAPPGSKGRERQRGGARHQSVIGEEYKTPLWLSNKVNRMTLPIGKAIRLMSCATS